MKEKQNGILCHSNGCGKDADQLGSKLNNKDEYWNTPEREHSVIEDDCIDGHGNEMINSVVPCGVPSQLFNNDEDLYTDKNVMECELPELIVCYKESTYNDVKDICIDEGVLSASKILIERSKDDNKHLHNSCFSDKNEQSDLAKGVDDELFIADEFCDKDAAEECGIKEKMVNDMSFPNGLESLSDDVNDNVAAKECLQDSLLVGEAHCDAMDRKADGASKEEFFPSSMLSVQEFGAEKSLKSRFESSICDGCEVEQQSDQISYQGAITESSASVSAAKESDKNCPVDDSNVKSGTINFDFDPSKSAASSVDENPKHAHEQSLKSQNDCLSDDLSIASLVQHGGGESSFSAAGPASGLISYSGPMAYSGSLSLRSDSSTTSTRSFAFPILQSEWNSSPVRMAKADRRHLRKQRSWRQGLLCCRF